MLAWILALQVAAEQPATAPAGAGASGATAAPAATPEPACEVIDINAGKADATPLLVVGCGGKGVMLGAAQRYRASYNADTRSIVVAYGTSIGSRVVLVSQSAGGALQVDDVTRDLAQASGRYIEAGLGGLDIDLTQFATKGMISAAPSAATDAATMQDEDAGTSASRATPPALVGGVQRLPPPVFASAGAPRVAVPLDLKPYAKRNATAETAESGTGVPEGEAPASTTSADALSASDTPAGAER